MQVEILYEFFQYEFFKYELFSLLKPWCHKTSELRYDWTLSAFDGLWVEIPCIRLQFTGKLYCFIYEIMSAYGMNAYWYEITIYRFMYEFIHIYTHTNKIIFIPMKSCVTLAVCCLTAKIGGKCRHCLSGFPCKLQWPHGLEYNLIDSN